VINAPTSAGHLRIRTDTGELRDLDLTYVASHLEHAYALTGHGAQSGIVAWAGVIGRPEEFTREWAYTALSRARDQTVVHVISERSERDRERDDYGPAVEDRNGGETLRALHRAMKRSEAERLAIDHGQPDGALGRRLTEANACPPAGARTACRTRHAQHARPPPPTAVPRTALTTQLDRRPRTGARSRALSQLPCHPRKRGAWPAPGRVHSTFAIQGSAAAQDCWMALIFCR
jgi:hypothetical protein